ncbi:MAG: ATP-binding protein [Oscillospiraceae bacterium]|nr:ATP-binding protein [Oscillospiraceae bacterium]
MFKELIERPLYIDQVRGFIDKDFVKIIAGIRRSGKSGLLGLLQNEIRKNTDNSHIIEMNFEKADLFHIKNYEDLTKHFDQIMTDDRKYYVFMDEPQEVVGWEKAVNALRFRNTDIYITGSNSKLLSGEFATLLGGRIVTFNMYPLSFKEFIEFRKQSGFGSGDTEKELDAFIRNGGFPAVSVHDFSEQDIRRIVTDTHSTALLRDVINRNKLRDPQLLNKIIEFMYDNVGSLISFLSITNYLKSNGRKGTDLQTITNYVRYLEEGYLIKRAPRYDVKGKKLLETNEKYFLADHSQQYVVRDFRIDNIDGILENIVYNELVRRGYNVYVGKLDTREIDFVAEKPNGEKMYVQVTYEFTKGVYEREFNPLKTIKDNHPKFVVSPDNFVVRNDEGVIGILLKDFLLMDS